MMRSNACFHNCHRRLALSVLMLAVLCHRSDSFSTVAPPTKPTFAVVAVDDGMAAAERLQDYVDRMGATRCCEIGMTKYGRGLVATKDLAPGETILKVPLACTLLVDTTQNESLLLSDAWASHLAAQLTQQLHAEEPTPYVDALPPPPSTPTRGDWSIHALKTLENSDLLGEIQEAKEWRNRQCEDYIRGRLGVVSTASDPQVFLDALDLVSSRTMRCGNKFMLVPLLDMANHASRDQGGGYYEMEVRSGGEATDHIVLKAGDRGVKAGNEVCLDYGDRINEEWLMHYGFLPDRNTAETVVLPRSMRRITWADVNTADNELKEECRQVLESSDTTLSDDNCSLRQIGEMEERDWNLEMALQYRISRKTMLSAVGGMRTASAFSSVFFDLVEEESLA